MGFAGINYLAVLLAGITAFITAGFWYGFMQKPWLKAVGLTMDEIKNIDPQTGKSNQSKAPFIIAFIGQLVMAFMMAGMMGHFGVNVKSGVITALIMSLGFLIPAMGINYAFQMRSFPLFLIDSIAWVLGLLAMGITLGLIGL